MDIKKEKRPTKKGLINEIETLDSNKVFNLLSLARTNIENLIAVRNLLRGGRKSMAYHLDAQNVSRILVAARTELRPNDIIFVADRPIISFSRTLAEITPLRILLRDIDAGNIP